ncbi:MAG: serine/threonine-protein kinase [Nitrospinota bacterium]|nr:serine/threonine-protein kinase [Nitrospinota bacterium]
MDRKEPFNLGRYKIIDELGRGAMGVVYKGLDTGLDRVVAVKTINIQRGTVQLSEDEINKTFMREAQIAGKLSHPNIAAIYDIGVDQGRHFFVMEYVEGATLEDLITKGNKLSLTQKLRAIGSAARTLHYAHMRGVVHRDIKPANMLIIKNKEPKIMDFGVAKLATGNIMDRSETKDVFGTPSYMSPEQIKGEQIDHRTDIFSLGVSMYEFLVGKRPFEAKSLQKLLQQIVYEDPELPSYIDSALAKDVDSIVLMALKKNPNERFGFASQMADAIDLLIDKLESPKGLPKVIAFEKQRVIQALKKNYLFFADFSDEEILEISKLSSRENFKPDHVIFEEGDRGDKIYVIIEGKVRIVQRYGKPDQIELSVLKEGDCFGEMAVIDNSPRSATAVVLEGPVTAMSINEIVMRITRPELCVKLYKNLASIISEKLRKTDTIMQELVDKLSKLVGS